MQTSVATPSPLTIEQRVIRLRGWQADGRDQEVLSETSPLLAAFPENRDILLIAAIAHRRLGRLAEAKALLSRLEALQPRFSRMHQEWGLCHVAERDAPGAIDRLLRAVNLNPALPGSWRMLVRLYHMVGDAENAALAEKHVETLQALPPEVINATSLLSDGDLAPAEKIVRSFLLRHGDHIEAMRVLARIGLALDVLDDAETLLAEVVRRAPDYQAARYDYAQTLIRRQKHKAAQAQIERLLALDAANLEYRTLAATAALGLGRQEEALAIYDAMLSDVPSSWDVLLWRGHVLKTIGRVPEAIDSYRASATARPDFGDAYWSLANLKTYRFGDEELARMRVEEAEPKIGLIDRYHLCFALGKALEDRGEIAESWTYYERGNALKRSESRYRPEIIETNTKKQIEVFTPAFLQARAGWGDPSPDPIFILGLPRSGSTLLEQILASHSEVEGTQELPDIQAIVLDLQGREPDLDNPRYPAVLHDLTERDFRRLGEKYLADTQVFRKGRPFFIDKMPNNFRHIGLIHLMLPNAKIIDARREPMACCFSNLKQLFAQGQEFTYSIEDIARYYRTYVELMDHWASVLPGRILRMQHEDVVADLEGQVRRMLDYCGLDFEPGCVKFHETERNVRTPSSEQVRRPIFRDSLDQWRKYEEWLGPLITALGDGPKH
jgi:tetratricopeptide (TPR) repeat protein